MEWNGHLWKPSREKGRESRLMGDRVHKNGDVEWGGGREEEQGTGTFKRRGHLPSREAETP